LARAQKSLVRDPQARDRRHGSIDRAARTFVRDREAVDRGRETLVREF
jgi:hypothetical protein